MQATTITEETFGPKLTLRGAWTKELAILAVSRNVRHLDIQLLADPLEIGLGFLADIPRLKRLDVLDATVKNIAGIHLLSELRYIDMSDYSKEPIDFTKFPLLTVACMEYSRGRESVGKCPNLEVLRVQHFSEKNLAVLNDLNTIRELWFSQGSLGDISLIRKFSQVQSVSFMLLRNLRDLSPLSSLQSLEKLDLRYSKNFSNIEALAGMKSLKRLDIGNCGDIESLLPLESCTNLEALFFADTNILDGDMSILLRMPNLKTVVFLNKRHYSVRREDIPAFWNCPFE